MFRLQSETPRLWVDCVLSDFDAFLQDHLSCERKASATAMSMVLHYPDREMLVDVMVDIAKEEMDHFHQVFRVMRGRGVKPNKSDRDPYLHALRGQMRSDSDGYLLDRLLVGSVVEARGCERFVLIAKHHSDASMREFYEELGVSEAKHHAVFANVARAYFSPEEVERRLRFWLKVEADAIGSLPVSPRLH